MTTRRSIGVATLSSKYQVVIPEEVRQPLGLRAGQQFYFVAKGGIIHLIPQIGLKQLKGSLPPMSVDDVREEEDVE